MVLSKKNFYLLAGLFLLCGGLAMKFLSGQNSATPSAVRIDSFPRSEISINGKVVGKTPYFDEKITAGQYIIKVDPGLESLNPWQTKIKLTSGTLAYISRNIAVSEEQSSGQILTLESLASDKIAELAVISTPDKAQVSIDGLSQGNTPLVLRNLTAGDHEIAVSIDGYSNQIIRGRIVPGYRLNAIVKLGVISGSSATVPGQLRPTSDLIASFSGSTPSKPYVVIKDTPTGFLRIRSDPSITASEVGQVKPGEKYSLLSETVGWAKIKLPSIFGWVSDQYVEKTK